MYQSIKQYFTNRQDTLRFIFSEDEPLLSFQTGNNLKIIGISPRKWIAQSGIFMYAISDSTGKISVLQERFGEYLSEYTAISD